MFKLLWSIQLLEHILVKKLEKALFERLKELLTLFMEQVVNILVDKIKPIFFGDVDVFSTRNDFLLNHLSKLFDINCVGPS